MQNKRRAANDALHFGVDNLTLWQLRASPTGRDSALIADISLRRIVADNCVCVCVCGTFHFFSPFSLLRAGVDSRAAR